MSDQTAGLVPVRRALLSVSDKTGLVEFAERLAAAGVELVSTGGTARALRDAGLKVEDVSALTGYPEMLDGRVKTLHPAIHGAILARRDDPQHMAALEARGIGAIDIVVVNLYPFEAARARFAAGETTFEACIEEIDIGGPAMIRAAAKNAGGVGVVVDPEDYEWVGADIARDGGLFETARRRLAAIAFARTAAYDAGIAAWLEAAAANEEPDAAPAAAATAAPAGPRRFALAGRRGGDLRYGENPHQSAAFYRTDETRHGVASARLAQGKPLSYNNLNDADAAFELAGDLHDLADRAAGCVIIKHANPCGAALGPDLAAAYERAHACDPVSAFGGVVAFTRPIDEAAAQRVTSIFTEVVIAPGADSAALEILKKKKNLRVLITDGLPDPRAPGALVRPLAGGFLMQSRDAACVNSEDVRVVTKRAPSAAEMKDLIFAFRLAKHVKSNAIVYAKDGASVGVGAGQMSRVDAARIAARKAEDAAAAAGASEPLTRGSVVASDAFFPFADGLLVAAEAGAGAVIQPGGSVRDDEVIAAADDAGLAMVFTGVRHFRH